MQLHVGDFDPGRFRPVRNSVGDSVPGKPVGGTWTSDFDPVSGSPWVQFRRQWDHADQQPMVVLTPSADAHVLTLHTDEDVDWLLRRFPGPEHRSYPGAATIDFEALAERYDGLSVDGRALDALYSRCRAPWDVPSTVWFNNRCFHGGQERWSGAAPRRPAAGGCEESSQASR